MPLIKSARVNSVQNLAVTEHISQFREAREEVQFSCYHKSGVVFDSLRDYLNEFRKLEADHTLPLKLNAGLEVDFIPRYEETIRKYVEQEGDWAMLLCAVHEFDEIGGVERPGLPQDRESSKDRWRRYIQTQIEALESRYIRFKVLAHPVRLVASTPVYPDEILEMLRGLAIAGERRMSP
jgi:HisJ family histidinol phosphate phosphatase